MAGKAQAGNFMFVEYSKPVETIKGQKKRRGGPSEVRAHITKNYHKALRVKRLQSLKKGQAPSDSEQPRLDRLDSWDSVEDDVEEIDFADPSLTNQYTPTITSRTSTSPSTSTDWSTSPKRPRSESLSSTQSPVNLPKQDSSLALVPNSSIPQSTLAILLGAGRLDPFDVLPAKNLSAYIHRVLDHALVHSWPDTVPLSQRLAPTNPVKSSWLHMAMDHPVAFHAFLYATSFHILCAYGGKEVHESAELLRLSHKVETIKLVNEQLQNLSLDSGKKGKRCSSSGKRKGSHAEVVDEDESDQTKKQLMRSTPTDALIMAVTILSIHHQRDETIYPKVHALSPLAKLNNLDVYGAMINDEKHIQGIMLLVAQRGGPEAMEVYGLADTLRLCDLYFATKYVQAPKFAGGGPVKSLVAQGKHLLDSAAIEVSSTMGAGFQYLCHSSAGRELVDILNAYVEITVALDHSVRGGPTAPELVGLTGVRNCTQHRLLAQLPNPLDLSDPEACVHQAIRLAALIFSDMVIFPLPPTQCTKPRLAVALRQTLEACRLLDCWEQHSPVLLWALCLGAIAASYTAQRSWYIDQLLQDASLMHIENWFILETICSGFLWWKPVCSEPLKWVWTEMVSPTPIDAT